MHDAVEIILRVQKGRVYIFSNCVFQFSSFHNIGPIDFDVSITVISRLFMTKPYHVAQFVGYFSDVGETLFVEKCRCFESHISRTSRVLLPMYMEEKKRGILNKKSPQHITHILLPSALVRGSE